MTDLFRFSYRSIRGKLTLAAVTPLLLILILVALAASYLISASIVNQTQKQIHNDLNAANVILNQEQQRVREVVRFVAHSSALLEKLPYSDLEQLATELSVIKQRENLDILNLTDLQGKQLLTSAPPPFAFPHNFILSALDTGHSYGTVLFSESELRREDSELAKRAQIHGPSQSGVSVERRGLFLVAAIRIVDQQGEPIGCLYGGIMLNNNLPLIDRISELVYGQGKFEGVSVGSATIFLDKLRIATTVRMKNGQRALGTQVSSEVAEAVLQRGETWLARAQVVDEWYLTAYEPIFDDRNKAVGAIYVGVLEKPLTAVRNQSFLTLFGLLILGCLLGGLLASFLARRLSRPVLELAVSAKRIAGGERDVQLPIAGQDEIGHLTETFADMASALKQRDEELQDLNRELEEKVAKRTSQLEEKGLQLIETQEQLLRQEKLAAIGSLATGVAHEINNPAAIIRGNVEILQMSLPADASEREEVAEIMKQVERVSLITQNLLSFSREQSIHPQPVQLVPLLEEILDQISHQAPMADVTIKKNFCSELPDMQGDRERLRQVFNNILLNAVQAMDGQGVLTLSSSFDDCDVQISIEDSGPGFSADVREKIFNPFFTTKSNGTGLGLSVSYGIIQAHSGSIDVSSVPGQGATFRIHLPLPKSFS